MAHPTLSIITPCYNEEGNVDRCATEIAAMMSDRLPDFEYEHVFCDNCSTDGTMERLRTIAESDRRVKVIANSRNVGPFRSIANGLRSVSGDLVIPMVPADLQDPPAAIPELVERMGPELDVVYGIRANRRENVLLRAARASYYWALRRTGGTAPPPHAGEFMLVRRDTIEAVNAVGGSYPYIRGLVAQTNPRYATYSYSWDARTVGRSKNSVADLVDQALNGLVSTAKTPIRLALLLGVLCALVGIATGLANFILFLVHPAGTQPGIPTLIVATFFFGGVQLFFLGLIGEYVLSIHAEVRPAPPMFERERINFGDHESLPHAVLPRSPVADETRAR